MQGMCGILGLLDAAVLELNFAVEFDFDSAAYASVGAT